jgi:carboxypeptidase C (cathepsin A)
VIRRSFLAGVSALALPSGVRAARADEPANQPATARTVVTHHHLRLDATAIAYTATAGTLVLRDDHEQPTANVFSVAYTTGERSRPVTFAYNGGPGSASLWLHLGAFGPKRLASSEPIVGTGPARLDDNPFTLLDQTDLVFVDAVGTGYSTLAGKATTRDFYGVDEDLAAFAQFVRRWLVANDRVGAPIYLLGESYGTFRSAGLANRLQHDGTNVSGIVLISTLLDYADDFGSDGIENVTDAFAIPSEAAVAWYHKKISAPDVTTAIARARAFTTDVYLPALLRSGSLSDNDRSRIAAELHDLIGLDVAYIARANLRISKERFEGELLRSDGRILGRYDGRYDGIAVDRNSSYADYDPSYEAIVPTFTAAFTDYVKNELEWRSDRLYRALPAEIVNDWNFRRGGFEGKVLAPSVVHDLREALSTNPKLRVFSAAGYYDLATPMYGAEYELANVAFDPSATRRITHTAYPAGHMIYLDTAALRALRADLQAFYAGSPK